MLGVIFNNPLFISHTPPGSLSANSAACSIKINLLPTYTPVITYLALLHPSSLRWLSAQWPYHQGHLGRSHWTPSDLSQSLPLPTWATPALGVFSIQHPKQFFPNVDPITSLWNWPDRKENSAGRHLCLSIWLSDYWNNRHPRLGVSCWENEKVLDKGETCLTEKRFHTVHQLVRPPYWVRLKTLIKGG